MPGHRLWDQAGHLIGTIRTRLVIGLWCLQFGCSARDNASLIVEVAVHAWAAALRHVAADLSGATRQASLPCSLAHPGSRLGFLFCILVTGDGVGVGHRGSWKLVRGEGRAACTRWRKMFLGERVAIYGDMIVGTHRP